MPDNENRAPTNHHMPWNKGKLIGARPPLRCTAEKSDEFPPPHELREGEVSYSPLHEQSGSNRPTCFGRCW